MYKKLACMYELIEPCGMPYPLLADPKVLQVLVCRGRVGGKILHHGKHSC